MVNIERHIEEIEARWLEEYALKQIKQQTSYFSSSMEQIKFAILSPAFF